MFVTFQVFEYLEIEAKREIHSAGIYRKMNIDLMSDKCPHSTIPTIVNTF
jgi:hypothetical protein